MQNKSTINMFPNRLLSSLNSQILKHMAEYTCAKATNPNTILNSSAFNCPGTFLLALFHIWPNWSRGRSDAIRMGNKRLVSMTSDPSTVLSVISLYTPGRSVPFTHQSGRVTPYSNSSFRSGLSSTSGTVKKFSKKYILR